ncbi:MAG: bifunctional phosphopantothenoylcysteine decarboxylase/phosphopantothenate--cysteine ligase CoaBC [Bacteriovoracia bacterium]
MFLSAYQTELLSSPLCGKKVLLGITGSIAAFEACDLIRGLREAQAQVKVIFSDSAEKFVTKITVETLSANNVYSSLWDDQATGNHHIDLARWADYLVIYPATANTIAKLANGFSDNLLTTVSLAFVGPKFIAPAMNPTMYTNPATTKNLQTLANYNWNILEVQHGKTSCGEVGEGRLLNPLPSLFRISLGLTSKNQKNILVSLGATKAELDPVRFITNRSSGKMGLAFVWQSLLKGYDVSVACGVVSQDVAAILETLSLAFKKNQFSYQVATHAANLFQVVEKNWKTADVYIGSAAVLDWDFKKSNQKIKKSVKTFSLTSSEKTRDILAWVSRNKRKDQFVLGFAAETKASVLDLISKKEQKGCDALFANIVSQKNDVFGSDHNQGFWIANEILEIPRKPKLEVAQILLNKIENIQKKPRSSRKRLDQKTQEIHGTI